MDWLKHLTNVPEQPTIKNDFVAIGIVSLVLGAIYVSLLVPFMAVLVLLNHNKACRKQAMKDVVEGSYKDIRSY